MFLVAKPIKKFSRLLRNVTIYHRSQKTPPLDLILSEFYIAHAFNPVSSRSTLILSSNLPLVFPLGFEIIVLYTFLTYNVHATCSAHPKRS